MRAANAFCLPAVRFKDYEQGHAAVNAFLENSTPPIRTMRRSRQQLSQQECVEILQRATSGVLALNGDAGYNYAVPLSFAYVDGKIHFHCAKKGHKIDAIRRNPRVSFCVIDQDLVDPANLTTLFRSVISFGHARILEDPDEIRASARLLGMKYAPDYPEKAEEEINQTFDRLCCVEITIDHMTGKEGIELTKMRNTTSAG